jgi:hypothetical protein
MMTSLTSDDTSSLVTRVSARSRDDVTADVMTLLTPADVCRRVSICQRVRRHPDLLTAADADADAHVSLDTWPHVSTSVRTNHCSGEVIRYASPDTP